MVGLFSGLATNDGSSLLLVAAANVSSTKKRESFAEKHLFHIQTPCACVLQFSVTHSYDTTCRWKIPTVRRQSDLSNFNSFTNDTSHDTQVPFVHIPHAVEVLVPLFTVFRFQNMSSQKQDSFELYSWLSSLLVNNHDIVHVACKFNCNKYLVLPAVRFSSSCVYWQMVSSAAPNKYTNDKYK
jgi:hypothetical protein